MYIYMYMYVYVYNIYIYVYNKKKHKQVEQSQRFLACSKLYWTQAEDRYKGDQYQQGLFAPLYFSKGFLP